MSAFTLVAALFAYLAVLFWVAQVGDRRRFNLNTWPHHPLVYTLSLGVYCTSWTFYGLVGTAATQGWFYLPIILGPILLFTLGYPLLRSIAGICRQEHIHSIADFIASRYGKRQSIAALVTVIVLATTVPYIALQLKAITSTLAISVEGTLFASEDIAVFVAVTMTLFTMIFGTNRLDVASYHSGLMVAIAFESLVKIAALICVAIFVFGLSKGFDLNNPYNSANLVFQKSTLQPSFWVMTLVSAMTILCLPRMFQVTFVECLSENHLSFARRGFTLYLLIIAATIFVIAWGGNQLLAKTNIASDTYVLAIPIEKGQTFLTLLTFLGGFSAATAMIIVATLTLSLMLSNDVILPLLLRFNKKRHSILDFSRTLIITRRLTAISVIAMAWQYQNQLAENIALTEIGLIAFALAVQLAPAIIFGLYWQRGNACGVAAGLASGTTLWFVTLMLPLLASAGFIDQTLIENGLLGIELLRPEKFLGFDFSDAYTRGVILSLSANITAFYLVSTLDITRLSDRIQAVAFVKRARANIHSSTHNLEVKKTDLTVILTQFLGQSETARLLENEPKSDSSIASAELLDFAEQGLSGVVGVASSRAILSSLSSGEQLGVEDVVNIFEETTRKLQFNQDMLFASFESISSAISVVNIDLQMVAWNKRYEQMFNYPTGMLRAGIPVSDLVRFNAERGMLGAGAVEELVRKRLSHLASGKPYRVVRNHANTVIEIKGRPLPKGGYVTTYDDISEFIDTQNELEKANRYLEQRVLERTKEVEKINESLRQEVLKRSEAEALLLKAKLAAEKSNKSKTQFLAIASHDILQPLNAANLYASALREKADINDELKENLRHLHGAIGSAELIISNLLEISSLDTGALTPQVAPIALHEILEPLVNEYRVQRNPNVELRYVDTSLWTKTDPKYLRRILQNFFSNATKYTIAGKILIGCRRRKTEIEICVYDTGPGISEAHQKRIFDDFYRVRQNVEGAGLGLGIALRFANLLNHSLHLHSDHQQRGAMFSVSVPMEAKSLETKSIVTPQTISSGLEGLNVFYVDDDKNNIRALAALMRSWACNFDGISDHTLVDEYIQLNEAPDIILMDFQLGAKTNGLELAQKMQRKWLHTPVCIVSAATDANLAEEVSKLGYDYLRKPIKPSKLRALLERYKQK